MQVLKLKHKTANKIELAQMLLSVYCLMNDIKISKTENLIMAYFLVYGIKKTTKDLILNSLILKSYNSLENSLTNLRKVGLVIRDKEDFTKVCPQLSSKKSFESRVGIIIELSND